MYIPLGDDFTITSKAKDPMSEEGSELDLLPFPSQINGQGVDSICYGFSLGRSGAQMPSFVFFWACHSIVLE